MMEEAQPFIVMMKDMVADKDPSDIINMDQTPITYSFPAIHTIEKKGSNIYYRHNACNTGNNCSCKQKVVATSA